MAELLVAVWAVALLLAGVFIGAVVQTWLAPLWSEVVGPSTTAVGYAARHRRGAR